VPIIATAIKDELSQAVPVEVKQDEEPSVKKRKLNTPEEGGSAPRFEDQHQSLLLRLLAEELGVEVLAIRDFELCTYDTQPPQLIGALGEFISARALDNQVMSYLILRGLVDSEGLADESKVRAIALFDNEEVGSESQYGAGSNMLRSALDRINGAETLPAALAASFFVSADMAHGVHPNYSDRHEKNHQALFHKGLVVKVNANQRYATTAVSGWLLSEVARKRQLPLQQFCVRQDGGCGSTIGPMISANSEVRTVDVGVPQLSMHSVRELCATTDLWLSYNLLKAVFEDVTAVDASLTLI